MWSVSWADVNRYPPKEPPPPAWWSEDWCPTLSTTSLCRLSQQEGPRRGLSVHQVRWTLSRWGTIHQTKYYTFGHSDEVHYWAEHYLNVDDHIRILYICVYLTYVCKHVSIVQFIRTVTVHGPLHLCNSLHSANRKNSMALSKTRTSVIGWHISDWWKIKCYSIEKKYMLSALYMINYLPIIIYNIFTFPPFSYSWNDSSCPTWTHTWADSDGCNHWGVCGRDSLWCSGHTASGRNSDGSSQDSKERRTQKVRAYSFTALVCTVRHQYCYIAVEVHCCVVLLMIIVELLQQIAAGNIQ